MDYNFLKSGTDIRGFASNLGGKEVELTDSAVSDIAAAFVLFVEKKAKKAAKTLKISLGHDSRITADRISDCVKNALVSAGVTVVDCGLASTPAMFMTTVDLGMDAAIQITASHHPFDRNGLKFFLPSGGLEGADISEILNLASNAQKAVAECKGKVEKTDYMTRYAENLRNIIIEKVNKGDKPLKGYHIIVDAGNGVGGFFANDVLMPLGADISGSQFLEPNGMFPNHIPNPENKEAMESVCKATVRSNADLGIIFDTDVDRAGCVDKYGNEINRNRLIALAAYIALEGEKGGTVVTDSVTSDGLKTYIEETLGGKHYRFKRGYKNVIDKAIELCDLGIAAPLAIETSGHAALKENYFLDDGAYLMTKIVIELAKGVDFEKILEPLKMPKEEKELRYNITVKNFKEYGLKVIEELEKFANSNPSWKVADDNREGVRVSTENGWFLLRLSVHDPVMPLNLESDVSGGTEEDFAKLSEFLSGFEGLSL
ncbi:MAG: phosphomannomutase/phosphoglucomutase [Clostridia bacterium]|nr:phosphomannomutase/phosphoglucomutase [Clostridia bacterium]